MNISYFSKEISLFHPFFSDHMGLHTQCLLEQNFQTQLYLKGLLEGMHENKGSNKKEKFGRKEIIIHIQL